MKKILMTLTMLLSIFIISCSANSKNTNTTNTSAKDTNVENTNNESSKAVGEGKIALASKEYDKAKNLFKLAVNEDGNNTEAKDLLDLTSNYIGLLSAVDNSEFDKANDLVPKIENSNKLDIIIENFNETKNTLMEKEKQFNKHEAEVESIEKLLNENKIDDAKKQATSKLNEIKGIKSLEDRLNAVITKVNEIIANAKATILKYYHGDYDVEYDHMEFYDKKCGVKELSGKAILWFIETQEGSPYEYFYRMEDGEVFRIDQGLYYWVSNNNKLIYNANEEAKKEQENKKQEKQEQAKKDEEKRKSQAKISPQEATKIAHDYFVKKHPTLKESDFIIGEVAAINENNEYCRGFCNSYGTQRVISEYYVNATTGKLRALEN